jgi:hypothetical protein
MQTKQGKSLGWMTIASDPRTPSLEKKLKPVGVFQKIKIKADLEGAGSTTRQHLISHVTAARMNSAPQKSLGLLFHLPC